MHPCASFILVGTSTAAGVEVRATSPHSVSALWPRLHPAVTPLHLSHSRLILIIYQRQRPARGDLKAVHHRFHSPKPKQNHVSDEEKQHIVLLRRCNQTPVTQNDERNKYHTNNQSTDGCCSVYMMILIFLSFITLFTWISSDEATALRTVVTADDLQRNQ